MYFITYQKIKKIASVNYAKKWNVLLLFIFAYALNVVGISLIAIFINFIFDPDQAIHRINDYMNLKWIHGAPSLIKIISVFLILFYLIKFIAGLLINKRVIDYCHETQLALAKKLFRSLLNEQPRSVIEKKSSHYVQHIQILTDSFSLE